MANKRKLSAASQKNTKRRVLDTLIRYITPIWVQNRISAFSSPTQAVRSSSSGNILTARTERETVQSENATPDPASVAIQCKDIVRQLSVQHSLTQEQYPMTSKTLTHVEPTMSSSPTPANRLDSSNLHLYHCDSPDASINTFELDLPLAPLTRQELPEGRRNSRPQASTIDRCLAKAPLEESGNVSGADLPSSSMLRSAVEAPLGTSLDMRPRLTNLAFQPHSRRAGSLHTPVIEANDISHNTLTPVGRSRTLYNSLKQNYGTALPYEQFKGLCAYVCALLQLGWTIHEQNLDHYIVLYREYSAALGELEEIQIQNHRPTLLAYHDWFSSRSHPAQSRMILTERGLRDIWAEHPYTFLKALYQLKAIAQASQRRHNDEIEIIDV